MKKFTSAAIACVLAATMAVPVLAEDTAKTEPEKVTAEAESEKTVAAKTAEASDVIKVVVNGTEVAFAGQAPVIKADRTLVPLRGVLEAMGIEVDWNDEAKSITAKRGLDSAYFVIGDTNLITNDGTVTLDVAPEIINGSTMIPLRAIAEAFGAAVAWDGEAKTVTVDDAKEISDSVIDTAKIENEYKAEDGTVLYTVSIEYPVLNDKCTAAGKASVNEAVKKSVEEMIANRSEELKISAEELYKSSKEGGEEFSSLSITGGYKLTFINDNVYSFYTETSYDFHGAHPISYRDGYTYDLASGKELALADVISGDTKAIIKNAYTEVINAAPENFFSDALTDLDKTLEEVDFYIKDGSVVFFTGLYSIAPYAAGITEVPVTADTLGEALKITIK